MPSTPNGFYVASQAQNMARHAEASEAKAFNRVALACMMAVAVGSILQIVHPIIKDLIKSRNRELDSDANNQSRERAR